MLGKKRKTGKKGLEPLSFGFGNHCSNQTELFSLIFTKLFYKKYDVVKIF